MDECWIGDVSSLNLRMMRRGECKALKDPLKFECFICGKKKLLGKTSSAMMRFKYTIGDAAAEEVWICGMCADVLTDALQYGPRVIRELHSWNQKSRVMRVSHVEEDLLCFECRKRGKTHIFIKFDDLTEERGCVEYKTLRACARCIMSYALLIKESEEIGKRKFKKVKVNI